MTGLFQSRLFQTIGRHLHSIIPRHCLFCQEKTHSNADLCPPCIDDFSLNSSHCQRCATPMEPIIGQSILLCGNCLSHHYYYNQVYSPYLYSEDIRYLITKLKYKKKLHYARILSELFIAQTSQMKNFKLPEAFIPMPMHPRRLRERGFNQALEISRVFAAHFQLPLNYTSLIRSRFTSLQAGLLASERQKNVLSAFTMHDPFIGRKRIANKNTTPYNHVTLVDDVMTTGSTANEAAKVLKKSGIKQVDVWTIARAGLM